MSNFLDEHGLETFATKFKGWAQERFATAASVAEKYPFIPEKYIPDNASLNDYLEPGSYLTSSNARAQTITNYPSCITKEQFRLDVVSAGSSVFDRNAKWQYFRQIVTTMSGEIAYRLLYIDGTAGQWKFDDWKTDVSALKLVWTNASPNSTFGEQTLTVPGAAHAKAVLIVYKSETASEWQFDSSLVPAGSPRIWCPHKSDGNRMSYRAARITDPASGKIGFSHGYRDTGGTEGQRDDDMIPNQIYALK